MLTFGAQGSFTIFFKLLRLKLTHFEPRVYGSAREDSDYDLIFVLRDEYVENKQEFFPIIPFVSFLLFKVFFFAD